MEAQEELKATRLQQGEKQKLRDSFILQLIDKSSDCKDRIMIVTKNASESQIKNTISSIEQKTGELLDLKNEQDSISMQMRDELIEIFNRMVTGLLKKLLTYEGQLRKQENEWQLTVDKLIESQ